MEKEVESGGAMDQYELEGPDRAELLQNLGEFQLALVWLSFLSRFLISLHGDLKATSKKHNYYYSFKVLGICSPIELGCKVKDRTYAEVWPLHRNHLISHLRRLTFTFRTSVVQQAKTLKYCLDC